jgi:type VI secretion system FHA domain protein
LSVEQSVDPLKLFAHDGLDLIPGNPEADIGGSTRDDAREIVASFRVPSSRVDPGMLPNESAADIIAPQLMTLAPSDESVSVGTSANAGANAALENYLPFPSAIDKENGIPLSPLPPVDLSQVDTHAVGEQKPQQDQDSTSTEGVEPSDPDLLALASLSITNTSPTPQSIGDAGIPKVPDTDALMTAFKRGTGLKEWPATTITPELMETLGRLLRAATQGAVSLLAARATIKQEIHLSVTLINPKSNNPLKFLPDGHTALLQMLGPKMPGFMAPVDAMREAFDDLLTHQTAIAAGTQATMEALFRRFDPDVIESQHPKNGIGEKLSQTTRNARLWNTYTEQYRLIKEEIKDDFFKRLGAEFHDAYNREYDSYANGKK